MTVPPGSSVRFNPPPNWPAPPPGWTPPAGCQPDPAWGPPPTGWEFWVMPPTAPASAWDAAATPGPVVSWYRQVPRRTYAAAGTAVIGIVIADAVPGVAGHVIALVVWVTAGILLIQTARFGASQRVRIGARIGLAACAVFAVYAGSLAVSSVGGSGDNFCFVTTRVDTDLQAGVLAI